jgi:hypothetical protein
VAVVVGVVVVVMVWNGMVWCGMVWVGWVGEEERERGTEKGGGLTLLDV